jgi:cyanophycin synthetase
MESQKIDIEIKYFMEIRRVIALRGPNLWASFPVLEAWVDLKKFNDLASNEMPGFNERLMAWLPSLIEHRCSVGKRGGFFERLRRGTYLAHILEHVALEVQTLAGTPVGFGKTRETDEIGLYKVVIDYEEETLARECLQVAYRICLGAVYDQPVDLPGEIDRLRNLAQKVCFGPSTRSIVDAAKRRRIPVRRISTGSLVVLGHGSRQRRILAAETDQTSAIAEGIAQDKQITKTLLKAVGVPVPYGREVSDAQDAWSAAEAIGLPVTVKPLDGSKGRGVTVHLTSREDVMDAYAAASVESSNVLVEEFVTGKDYRLLIVGNKLVAAAHREPAHIMGDGIHTVQDLIARENANPLRGDYHALPLSKIPVDAVSQHLLAEQGLTLASVPPSGTKVLLRRNANLSTGGTAVDVTDQVHPEIARAAQDAARAVGLDVAGVDIVVQDLGSPLEEQKGAVVEVNAAPGLRMHTHPSQGIPRPVGDAIVSTMFGEGETGRIPIAAITGVNGKTTTTRFITHLLKETGLCVGMTCSDGIYVDGRRIDNEDCSGPQSARAILLNPIVQAAVLETARGGILREGLGFDYCDVAVVTNIGDGDHLDLTDINTVEKLAMVKRTVVEAVAPDTGAAVLNAADPLVADMASYCPGKVVFFGRDSDHPVITEHRKRNGRAVMVRDKAIFLAEGDHEERLISLKQIPLTHCGRIGFLIENALAAIAAAWCLNIPLKAIIAGAKTFEADPEKVPGRFNVFKVNGSTVIVDYGHNVSSLKAIIEAIEEFPHSHRTIVYSTAGDRRDCDIIHQGKLIGRAFDSVVLYEGHYLRGRNPGEIIKLFRHGMSSLNGDGRTSEVIEIFGATKAIDVGLQSLRKGELMVIQADVVDETIEHIQNHPRDFIPFVWDNCE